MRNNEARNQAVAQVSGRNPGLGPARSGPEGQVGVKITVHRRSS